MHQKWFFLPRRASKERYDGDADERRGANLMFTADDEFRDIRISSVGERTATRGFSSFKFVPGTGDTVIVALKSEENNGKTATYISAFDINGVMLLSEQWIANDKYEGIEFL